MKKVFFATISLTIIACLSFIVFSYFNHANPILSETDVINDFLTSHPLISNNTVSVENVHITKRRTKSEDGTDSVYLCLTASNDKYTYTGNYVILNQLYNDGWKRETITTESELYKPKRGVSNEELDSHLSQFSMFVLSEPANHVTELDRGIERISYNAEFLAQTFSISAYITLIYEWDFHSGAWELYQLDYNPQLYFINLIRQTTIISTIYLEQFQNLLHGRMPTRLISTITKFSQHGISQINVTLPSMEAQILNTEFMYMTHTK